MKSAKHHSLEQLAFLKDLSLKESLTKDEIMYIVSELPAHGLLDFHDVAKKFEEHQPNRIFLRATEKKQKLWNACRQQINSSKIAENSGIMRELYGPNSVFYRNSSRSKDVLIVAFTTMFNNFYISNAVLASVLIKTGCSFLILKDQTEHYYLNGITEFGSDLNAATKKIEEFAVKSRFKDIRILSYSASGYASMLYAANIPQTTKVLCLSPRTDYSDDSTLPAGDGFDKIRNNVPRDLRSNLKDMLDFSTFATTIVYGSENKIDQAHAENLSQIRQVDIQKHDGCGHETPSFLLVNDLLDDMLLTSLLQ
jgi:hypothetical protein